MVRGFIGCRVAGVVVAVVVLSGCLDIPADHDPCPGDPEAFRSVELLPPGCRP